MSKGNGLTRGDKRRNQRLAELRGLLPAGNAVVGVDLGEDVQMLVVADRDSRVVARRKVTGKAFELGAGLDWAGGQAAAAGFCSVTVACEPTGARWMQLRDLAEARGWVLVGVQPLATHLARESEDYTRDKSDYKDAVLIARLALELRCYIPERAEAEWALLRHLGCRRAQLVGLESGCVQRLGDLLGLAWPAMLATAAQPFDSLTWQACLAVVLDRCNGDPGRLRRLGLARFTTAVRRELSRWGGQRVCHRIAAAVFTALGATTGAVTAQRAGALARARWALSDLREARTKRVGVAEQMVTQLQWLGVAEPLASIPGLSPIGAACILAETGDPARFATARSLVKHAGLNPTENTSGGFRGRTRISKRGRPGLRLAAWRATWTLIRHNRVTAARYQYLTGRDQHRLTGGQAHAACAAALLRWIHAIATTRRRWDPSIAGVPAPHDQPAAA